MGDFEGQEIVFKEQVPIVPCSWNECTEGHRWPPTVAVVDCPGCKGPVVAFMLTNCPFCNEPVKTTSLRSDHVPRGGGCAPRCQGIKGPGDTMDLFLERNHWREATGLVKEFEEKRQLDRQEATEGK